MKWRDPATRKGVPDAAHGKNTDLAKLMQAGEENRLLYVGMTRAKSHMVLSYSTNDKRKARPVGASYRATAGRAARQPCLDHSSRRSPRADAGAAAGCRAAGEHLLDRLPRQDQHDSTASITDISVFAQCPRKYFLSRYIGWDAGSKTFVDMEDLPRVGYR